MFNSDPKQAVIKSIIVELSIERAFHLWTERISTWWPASHSISGDPETQVMIEAKVGGRLYERASNGHEYDWGAVDVWQPPFRLAFTWYLGSDQAHPTHVEVQFISLAMNKTRIELEHRGPELVGDLWEQRKHIFRASWETVLAEFIVSL